MSRRSRHATSSTEGEAHQLVFDFLDKYDLLGAFWLTVQLTFWSGVFSLVWGVILAAMRVSPVPVLRGFGTAYINIVRNTPLTVIIVATSLVLADTLQVTIGWTGSDSADQGFWLAILGFTAYTSTFVCESVRSGVNTVPVGQAEAARALGLGFGQVLGRIVLPQALRAVVAPLGSVLIALTKNTTIAAAISVPEAAALMKTMIENESDVILLVFAIFAFGFVVLTLPTGLLVGWVARKVAVNR